MRLATVIACTLWVTMVGISIVDGPASSSASPAPSEAKPAAAGPCGGVSTVPLSSRGAAPLSAAEECALKPKDSFRECANCPELVVVPAASFIMGSPESEKDRRNDEGPQHRVTIGKPFAVGKFHVTVDQFAAFVAETGHDAGSKCRTFEDGKVEERSWRNLASPKAGLTRWCA
jgi:formylglycine-generating enzyme required for sulfatase activity